MVYQQLWVRIWVPVYTFYNKFNSLQISKQKHRSVVHALTWATQPGQAQHNNRNSAVVHSPGRRSRARHSTTHANDFIHVSEFSVLSIFQREFPFILERIKDKFRRCCYLDYLAVTWHRSVHNNLLLPRLAVQECTQQPADTWISGTGVYATTCCYLD